MILAEIKDWYHADEYKALFCALGELQDGTIVQAPDGAIYDPRVAFSDIEVLEGYRLFQNRVTGQTTLLPLTLHVHPVGHSLVWDKNRALADRIGKELWRSVR